MRKFFLKKGVNCLPRGGYLVSTSKGYIQLGAPPETIKDTMILPKKVPLIFILPRELFNVKKGIAVAEIEFPIYFNHFLCQKKTLILCTEKQKRQFEIVLQEAIFGPQNIDLKSEFLEGENSKTFPDLKAEMEYFRGNRQLSDLIEFGLFKDGQYKIENTTIIQKEGIGFTIIDKGKEIADLPWTIDYNIKYDIGESLPEPYNPPKFGITCLGPSHGFDPEENTSGFILWIDHRGIMIDPPVNSTEWLRKSNVNPKLIKSVILTHCHADHDAGTFQKILEESPINIYTTETIMDSFIRKYRALTKLSKKVLYELFNFQPIILEKPTFIEEGRFLFNYSLHSIPTLGFRVHYQNTSFLYTSDHLNDPEVLDKLYAEGVFPEGRYKFLKNFPWHYDTIYHEAGIPPIHTPISYLSSLPEKVQENITVYHISKKDFPKKTKLRLAKFGIENTLYPEIISMRYEGANRILDVMNNVDLFQDFKIVKAREFLSIIEEESFKRGDHIIRKGTMGDKFYIVVSGNITVRGLVNEYKKTYGQYEYFGEASLLNDKPRAADVIAETDVNVLTIEKNAFLNFISGSKLETSLRRLSEFRDSNSWDTLSKSEVFGDTTSYQKTQLEGILHFSMFRRKTILYNQNKENYKAYIIMNGKIDIIKNDRKIHIFEKQGDLVGDIFCIQKKNPSPFTAITSQDSELYYIFQNDLNKFIQNNPGIYMRLMRAHENISDEAKAVKKV